MYNLLILCTFPSLCHCTHSAADPLLRMFEFIESPMQKVKRAGLGLLSMGLGRWVDGVACIFVVLCVVLFLLCFV